jgi:hypothetical protein
MLRRQSPGYRRVTSVTAETTWDETGEYREPEIEASFRGRLKWSPQLRLHEIVCGGAWGSEKGKYKSGWIDGLVDHNEVEARRRLDRVGRRQYALELVQRERIVASFRSKESRYQYRTDTALSERAEIAAALTNRYLLNR